MGYREKERRSNGNTLCGHAVLMTWLKRLRRKEVQERPSLEERPPTFTNTPFARIAWPRFVSDVALKLMISRNVGSALVPAGAFHLPAHATLNQPHRF